MSALEMSMYQHSSNYDKAETRTLIGKYDDGLCRNCKHYSNKLLNM